MFLGALLGRVLGRSWAVLWRFLWGFRGVLFVGLPWALVGSLGLLLGLSWVGLSWAVVLGFLGWGLMSGVEEWRGLEGWEATTNRTNALLAS